jgi:hypothetical protein
MTIDRSSIRRVSFCHRAGWYVTGIVDKAEFAALVNHLVDATCPYTEQDVHYRWLHILPHRGAEFSHRAIEGRPHRRSSFRATCIGLDIAPLVEEKSVP